MFVLDSGEVVISDVTPVDQHVPDGCRTGAVPRDLAKHPKSMFATPDQLVPFDEATLRTRLSDQIAGKARLSDIRDTNPKLISLDQNGQGYCWGHSTTNTIRLEREVRNLPYADLSAFSLCCLEKNYRDEGGWCGESAAFATKNGIATSEFWPQRSMSRANDTPAMRANMALHKITAGWYDLSKPQYDQRLNFMQVLSLLAMSVPCALDFNWWSHSVCGADGVDGTQMATVSRYLDSGKLVYTNSLKHYEQMWGLDNPVTGGFSVRIWNSWSDTWGARGMGVLTGNKAIPDNAIATISSVLSAK